MKVVGFHKTKSGYSNHKKRFKTPIEIVKPEKKTLKPGEYDVRKCRTDPADTNSGTFEIKIGYFSSGSPEEWLDHIATMKRVRKGQGLTTGPQHYELARSLLSGSALTTFNNLATETATETVDHYNSIEKKLTKSIFPKNASRSLKRFLRRHARKPVDMDIEEHTDRIVEVNEFLPKFPDVREADGGRPAVASTKLDDDELMDCLEHSVPPSWRTQMDLLGFDCIDSTIAEFKEFCKRVERAEASGDDDKGRSQKDDDRKPAARDKRSRSNKDKYARKGGDKFCMLHGYTNDHTTEDCRVLKHQAKRMKATYEAQHPSARKDYNRKQQKQEMHTMCMEAVETAMDRHFAKMAASKKKRKRAKSEAAETYNFEDLSIDDNDDKEEQQSGGESFSIDSGSDSDE